MSKKIGTQMFASFVCLLMVFSFSIVNAASSKDFIQCLPDSINGIEKTGEVETTDVEKMGQKLSAVTQEYGNEISLNIADGTILPQLKKFERMKQLTMENEEKIVKRIKVEGYEAGYEFYKRRNKGNLLIKLSDTRIIVIQAKDVINVDELVSMTNDIPISEIANH